MNAVTESRTLVQDAFANPKSWASSMATAEAVLRKALNDVPDDVALLTCLGAVLCDQGKHRHAAELLEKAVRLGSTDRNTHYNLGVALLASARPAQATAAFKRAKGFTASPRTWEAYFDAQAQ